MYNDINELLKYPSSFEKVTEDDVIYIFEDILPLIAPKIKQTILWLGKSINGDYKDNPVLRDAYELNINNVVNNAIYTYLEKEKWKQNVPILFYLLKCITRFSDNIIKNLNGKSLAKVVPICLLCKYESNKTQPLEKLTKKEFICYDCKEKLDNHLIPDDKIELYQKLHKHSVNGVKCPICKRFVPNSLLVNGLYCCPYNDCNYVFRENNKFKHPSVVKYIKEISLQTSQNNSNGNISIIDKFSTKEKVVENKLIDEQGFVNKYKCISEIIDFQIKFLGNSKKIPIKKNMLIAFAETLKQYPEDMVDYIVIGKNISEISIQAAIFQNFIKAMEQTFPLVAYIKGDRIEINNITDSYLDIFVGTKSFVSYIDNSNIIRKAIGKAVTITSDGNVSITDEDLEDTFIGKLLSVKSMEDGRDLMPNVLRNSFTAIEFNASEQVKKGSDVIVTYEAIKASYCLGIMAYVQRIKKKISDSAMKKLKTISVE